METITRSANGKPARPHSTGINNAALAAFARRAVWRANLSILVYAAIGAMSGYGLVALYGSYAALVAMVATYGLRLPPLPVLPFIDIALPAGMGILFALMAVNKAEENRFKSQLALHVLYLQELLERDRDNA